MTSIFKKAVKLKKTTYQDDETMDDRSIYYLIASGSNRYQVRVWTDNGTLRLSCTCARMSLRNPTDLCSHKIAAIIKRCENETV